MDSVNDLLGILIPPKSMEQASRVAAETDKQKVAPSRVSFERPYTPPINPRSSASSDEDVLRTVPPTAFTLFPLLPVELRTKIWRLSIPTRTIIVNHHEITHRVTRSNISEIYPLHLSIHRELRAYTLPLYRSLFPEPKQGCLKWVCTIPAKRCLVCMARACLDLTIPHDKNEYPIKRLLAVIEQAMNSHPEKNTPGRFDEIAKVGRLNKGTVNPAFFFPQQDTLYLRRPQPRDGRSRFLGGLWTPSKREYTENIQHLALEIDHLYSPGSLSLGLPLRETPRLWSRVRKYKNLTGLQSLALVLMGDREVIKLSLDKKGVLKENEWSFSLDLESTEFKEEMEDSWCGVTWHVVLSRTEGVGLWQAAKKWRPNCHQWEDDKRTVGDGKISLENPWRMTRRIAKWNWHYRRVLTAVEWEQGREAWLGPSRLS